MRIIISEQQASLILNKMKELISGVLSQMNIEIKDLDIIPTYFPKRGLKIILKLEKKEDRKKAKDLIDDLLGDVANFGDERKFDISVEREK